MIKLENGSTSLTSQLDRISIFLGKTSIFMLVITTRENFMRLKGVNNQIILKNQKTILKKKRLKVTSKRIIIEELN